MKCTYLLDNSSNPVQLDYYCPGCGAYLGSVPNEESVPDEDHVSHEDCGYNEEPVEVLVTMDDGVTSKKEVQKTLRKAGIITVGLGSMGNSMALAMTMSARSHFVEPYIMDKNPKPHYRHIENKGKRRTKKEEKKMITLMMKFVKLFNIKYQLKNESEKDMEDRLVKDIISKKLKFFSYPSIHTSYVCKHTVSLCGRIKFDVDSAGIGGTFTFCQVDGTDMSYKSTSEFDYQRVLNAIETGEDQATESLSLWRC